MSPALRQTTLTPAQEAKPIPAWMNPTLWRVYPRVGGEPPHKAPWSPLPRVPVRSFIDKGQGIDGRPHNIWLEANSETPGKMETFANWASKEGAAVYVIPGTVAEAGHAKAADVLQMQALVVDLDTGDIAAKRAHLEAHLGAPTMVVQSGGITPEGQQKCHIWWKLTEPAEGSDVARACRLRGDIAAKVGGDMHFRSAHQPIRVAGSVYYKNNLKGRIITADAMHTQRTTSEAVCGRGGDYVLALKGNQGTLFEDVTLYLNDPEAADSCMSFQSVDADHGRIETRSAVISDDIDWLQERHHWPGLKAIGKVTCMREIGGKQTSQTRYFLLSAALEPARFLEATRSHWRIENSLHWVLDVTMNEDQARNRSGNGPENLALLRRMALNLARTEPTKGSMRGKIKKAGWSDDFLLDMIRAAVQV
jgi:predicted transposase YbfD/YdcC